MAEIPSRDDLLVALTNGTMRAKCYAQTQEGARVAEEAYSAQLRVGAGTSAKEVAARKPRYTARLKKSCDDLNASDTLFLSGYKAHFEGVAVQEQIIDDLKRAEAARIGAEKKKQEEIDALQAKLAAFGCGKQQVCAPLILLCFAVFCCFFCSSQC